MDRSRPYSVFSKFAFLACPEQKPLAPETSWTLEVFDAVQCAAANASSTSTTIEPGGSVTVPLLAREGGGSSTKGGIGAHLRWQVWGKAPGGRRRVGQAIPRLLERRRSFNRR
jgi:hypothetical protein